MIGMVGGGLAVWAMGWQNNAGSVGLIARFKSVFAIRCNQPHNQVIYLNKKKQIKQNAHIYIASRNNTYTYTHNWAINNPIKISLKKEEHIKW